MGAIMVFISSQEVSTVFKNMRPSFEVATWGTFGPQAVRLVWNVVTGSPSYPDQFPYASHG